MKLVAENLTITSAAIRRAVAGGDPLPLRTIARKARSAGAYAIDVNLGPRRKELAHAVDFVLDALDGFWDRELWIDGSDAGAMARAARRWPHGVTLNGYSGNCGREEILRVAADFGLDLVVFLMTDRGIPPSADERLALAAELVGRANEAGVETSRIIIDPVLAPVGWMNGQALNAALLATLRELPGIFGMEMRSVLGLSNLLTTSAGVRPPEWLDEAFLALAAGAGLTHAMVDIENPRFSSLAKALSMFAGESPFAAAEFS